MAVVPLRDSKQDVPAFVLTGLCTGIDETGDYLVQQASGEIWQCRRAVSCLVKPQIGDSVMVCGASTGDLFVLAVLEQANEAQVQLDVPADLVLSVPHGNLHLETQGILRAKAGQQLSFQTDDLLVNAETGDVQVGSLRFVGRAVTSTVAVLKHMGQRLEQMVDRFTQSARTSTRVVQEQDTLRAGQVDAQASGLMKLHGKTTLMTGDHLVKVDSEQIHMG